MIACTLGMLSTAAWADMLIASSPAEGQLWNDDIAAKMLATGKITENIDFYDIRTGTPTLGDLLAYSAVMCFTDSLAADPNALGDVLADYVDAGGGVVQAWASNLAGYGIAGRWLSGGYAPFVYGNFGGGQETIGTRHVPAHPTLLDVDTFDGGSAGFRSTGPVQTYAIAIADWSGGDPLIAETPGKNGRIIGLNMFPPSSDVRSDLWVASTDGGHMMANAMVYVPEPASILLLTALMLLRRR
ncbi:MAG: PEP-CTERM sorting domain-containing protein [Phycisphaerae bacterium]